MKKTSHYLALCINISKTARDTSMVSMSLMTNGKLHNPLSIGI